MSAFIVEQKTINKIVTWLAQELERDTFLWERAHINKIDTSRKDWRDELAQAMYALNFRAVNDRYHEEAKTPKFYYRSEYYGSNLAVLKAVECWLYQCLEGNVPQDPLYKFFEEIERHLALKIVYGLPEWDKAVWG